MHHVHASLMPTQEAVAPLSTGHFDWHSKANSPAGTLTRSPTTEAGGCDARPGDRGAGTVASWTQIWW